MKKRVYSVEELKAMGRSPDQIRAYKLLRRDRWLNNVKSCRAQMEIALIERVHIVKRYRADQDTMEVCILNSDFKCVCKCIDDDPIRALNKCTRVILRNLELELEAEEIRKKRSVDETEQVFKKMKL